MAKNTKNEKTFNVTFNSIWYKAYVSETKNNWYVTIHRLGYEFPMVIEEKVPKADVADEIAAIELVYRNNTK